MKHRKPPRKTSLKPMQMVRDLVFADIYFRNSLRKQGVDELIIGEAFLIINKFASVAGRGFEIKPSRGENRNELQIELVVEGEEPTIFAIKLVEGEIRVFTSLKEVEGFIGGAV